MERSHLLAMVTAAVVAVAGWVLAQPTPAPVVGYLATPPDASTFLPPVPAPGSLRDRRDHAVYTATRAMAGSPRWALAAIDNDASVVGTLGHFSCAVGQRLSPQTHPHTTALLRRVIRDTIRAQSAAKDLFLRPRPYQVWGGEICVPRTASLDSSTDYPSGHATWGWAVGLILTDAVPNRRTALMSRARAFGESRAVCGMHTASGVEAGRTTGAAVVAAERQSVEFRADLLLARQELAQTRAAPAAQPLDAAVCATEAALTVRTPYAH